MGIAVYIEGFSLEQTGVLCRGAALLTLLTLLPSVSLQASVVSELQEDEGAAAALCAHRLSSLLGLRVPGPPPSDPGPPSAQNMDGLRLPPLIEEVLEPSGQSVDVFKGCST